MTKKDEELPFDKPPSEKPQPETEARTSNPPVLGTAKPPIQPATALLATLAKDQVQEGFKRILRERAPSFLASLVNCINSSDDLKSMSKTPQGAGEIIACATMAACLNLVIDKNLGFAWIVPYAGHPQFQIGYKGFIQLAQRTGQYSRINCIPVYKSQFISYNFLTEDLEADFTKAPEGNILGYAMYFRLVNGFEKTVYKTWEELIAHGRRYSKSFNSEKGLWKNNPEAMCFKTLVKMTLSKWGILSTEMQRATMADQSLVQGEAFDDRGNYVYPDNEIGTTGEQLPMLGEGKAGDGK